MTIKSWIMEPEGEYKIIYYRVLELEGAQDWALLSSSSGRELDAPHMPISLHNRSNSTMSFLILSHYQSPSDRHSLVLAGPLEI